MAPFPRPPFPPGETRKMAWRESLLNHLGPGLLGGITFGKWLRLLRDNRFAVAPSCVPRAMVITFQSVPTSLFHWNDQHKLRDQLKDVVVQPPVFLLGHWRHGTTHLHYLMTIDRRFAFPNNYQTLFPNSFLTAESLHSRVIDFFLPNRRPMDNVEWTMGSPQEDEFALCVNCSRSPCTGWVFPKRRDYYDRYLTMRNVSDAEIAEWKEAFLLFLKKLTWLNNRPLILKSPPHTARIKLLLQMFPDARFVHIHRNPFDVFHSSRRMLKAVFELHRLQRARLTDLDDWILRMYREMYESFFEERRLIPAGQFHEMCFEELEQDPVGQVRRIYEALNLPDFAHVHSRLQSYVDSIADYRKNAFPDLPSDVRQRISREWQRSFEEWGYPA